MPDPRRWKNVLAWIVVLWWIVPAIIVVAVMDGVSPAATGIAALGLIVYLIARVPSDKPPE